MPANVAAMNDMIVRTRELKLLMELPNSGKESATLVHGRPGSGKSRLFKAAHERSSHSTHRVSTNPGESAWPMAGLSVIASLLSASKGLESLPWASCGMDSSGHAEEPFLAALRFVELLHSANLPPTVVFIDDFDLMDGPSRFALGVVARRLSGTGVWMVFGVSTNPDAEVLGGLSRIRLEALSLQQACNLVMGEAGSGADPAVLQLVAAHGLGHPASLLSTIRTMTPDQRCGREPVAFPLSTSPTLDHEFTATKHSLDTGAWELLELLSLSFLTPVEVLNGVLGDSAIHIDTLLHTGLATLAKHGQRTLTIADPRLRSWIHWRLEPGRRRALHQELLRSRGTASGAFASWHECHAGGDQIQLRDMTALSLELLAQGHVGFSVEVIETTLQLDSADSDICAHLFAVAQAMLGKGEISFASRYLSFLTRQGPDASLALQLATLKTQIRYLATQRLDSSEVVHLASADGWKQRDHAVVALSTASLYHAERQEGDRAEELLGKARQYLDTASDAVRSSYFRAELLNDAVHGRTSRILKEHAELLAKGLGACLTEDVIAMGRSLALVEFHHEARRLFSFVLDSGAGAEPLWEQIALVFAAENEINAGEFRVAHGHIQALSQYPRTVEVLPIQRSLLSVWDKQTHACEPGGPNKPPPFQQSLFDDHVPYLEARQAGQAGSHELMTGRPLKAIWHLSRARDLARPYQTPLLARCTVELVEALILVGDVKEARLIADELTFWLKHRSRGWARTAAAFVSALVADDSGRDAAFEAALRQCSADGNGYEQGRIQLAHGLLLARSADTTSAGRKFMAAELAFKQAGADGWVVLIKRMTRPRESTPGPNLGRNRLLESLTADEREVAVRVVAGLRNKEIAGLLFVSVRTVEVRLTRVYRKLEARSRSHLATMLASAEDRAG